MSFTKILSTQQETGIGLVIIGIIIFINRNDKEAETLLMIISVIIVVVGIFKFYNDIMRKGKIINRYQKNFYDSNDEKKIADYFKRKDIAFVHHPSINVERSWWILYIPFGNIKIEPDFYLPEFDVYVEYWGMINDPTYKKEQYDRKNKLYRDNLLDLL